MRSVPEPLLLESLQRYNVVDIAFGGAHSVALLGKRLPAEATRLLDMFKTHQLY